MARAKQQELTLDEKLKQALVPEDEQPYEVPGNWVWTRLGTIAKVKGGKRLPKGHELVEYKTDNPYIRVTDFYDNSINIEKVKYILPETFNEIKNYTISCDDIYISIAGSIGKVGIIPDVFDGANLTENAAKITDIVVANQKYLMWLLQSDDMQFQMQESTIATTQAKLALFRIENMIIPLPPLAEQERIVDRIESFFAKLDQAKELVQNALDTFETRKAAILHKAFTGELTAKWREKNGVGMESWEEKALGDLSELITKGASPRWQGVEYTDDKSQTLFITSENVREGYIDFSKEKYLSNQINEIQKRSILKKGDVLLNIVGASIGRAAIFNIDKLANTNQAVCLIRLKEEIDNSFICYFLNSPIALQYYSLNKVDVARANISLGDVNAFIVNVPSLLEQQEIVRILDGLFEKEQKAKVLCDVIDKIDLMKKAILARAFRGELGTNDPSEESAVELLKEVLKDK